jgi:3-deoxy-D-manno-octulosonate 8-phosphate phosphatase (KDO 8-P phosphatase)
VNTADVVRKRMAAIKIVFMDIDGVMNDGRAIFLNGVSPKAWHVRDRLAIKLLKNPEYSDIRVVWISGRPSSELSERARELGVDEVFQDVDKKIVIMESVLSKYNIDAECALYIGDDLVDLACMEKAGISCCPEDAVLEAKETADVITGASGGRGCVREITQMLLQSRGVWGKIIEDYKEGL